jgi:plastocyanin
MKKITFFSPILLGMLLTLLTTCLKAQVKYNVVASGLSFTPSSLVINQGDTVEWNNISGFHNVNGTQATFPSNPISFGNGPAGAPWTYIFVFNTLGNYTYMCDVHGINMSGTITVQTPLQITEVGVQKNIKIYPNPATNCFIIDANQSISSVSIYNIAGKFVKKSYQSSKIDVVDLPKGIYILNIETIDDNIVEKIIIQ